MVFLQEASLFVWKTKAVLGLNLELAHSCPAWLPSRNLFCTLLCPWKEGDGLSLPWGQRCLFSSESSHICLLFSTKACFLEPNLWEGNRNRERERALVGETSGQTRDFSPPPPSITQRGPVSQKWLHAGFCLEAALSIPLPAFPCSEDTLSL